MVILETFEDFVGIKLGGPEPPANRIGLLLNVAEAVHLLSNRRKGLEAPQEFVLYY